VPKYNHNNKPITKAIINNGRSMGSVLSPYANLVVTNARRNPITPKISVLKKASFLLLKFIKKIFIQR
jgi:hypothetical protein